MTYSLWDKKTSIYNLSPEQLFNNNSKYQTEDVYLFYDDSGMIIDILPTSMLPEVDKTATVEARCEAFINRIKHRSNSTETISELTDISNSELTTDNLKQLIEELAAKNAILEECIVELAETIYA